MLDRRTRCHPTVHVPPWPNVDESEVLLSPYSLPVIGIALVGGDGELSPYTLRELKLFMEHRYLPSNSDSNAMDLADPNLDPYASDFFRMYKFKAKLCTKARSHDWNECPFAHPGEKARRRDPRKFQYLGIACPDFRNGYCMKGYACEYAHGVFECWLHPSKYRTQWCKDGRTCRRRVCFFAHTTEQLRLPSNQESSSKYGINEMASSSQHVRLGRTEEPDFGWVSDLLD